MKCHILGNGFAFWYNLHQWIFVLDKTAYTLHKNKDTDNQRWLYLYWNEKMIPQTVYWVENESQPEIFKTLEDRLRDSPILGFVK